MNETMTILLACKGPDAGKLMAENSHTANLHAVVVIVLSCFSIWLFYLLRRYWALPVACAALVVFHPAWTISASKGDCGWLKATAAISFTLLALVLLGGQVMTGTRVLAGKLRSLWVTVTQDEPP